jgi:CrcB protein
MTLLAVALAGALGAPARYLVERAARTRLGEAFPWGTFVVNISGSFALGALTGFVLFHAFDGQARTVIGTGFLGAYTTFSTFAYESVRLAESPETRVVAVQYLMASTIAGVGAAALGLALASI